MWPLPASCWLIEVKSLYCPRLYGQNNLNNFICIPQHITYISFASLASRERVPCWLFVSSLPCFPFGFSGSKAPLRLSAKTTAACCLCVFSLAMKGRNKMHCPVLHGTDMPQGPAAKEGISCREQTLELRGGLGFASFANRSSCSLPQPKAFNKIGRKHEQRDLEARSM